MNDVGAYSHGFYNTDKTVIQTISDNLENKQAELATQETINQAKQKISTELGLTLALKSPFLSSITADWMNSFRTDDVTGDFFNGVRNQLTVLNQRMGEKYKPEEDLNFLKLLEVKTQVDSLEWKKEESSSTFHYRIKNLINAMKELASKAKAENQTSILNLDDEKSTGLLVDIINQFQTKLYSGAYDRETLGTTLNPQGARNVLQEGFISTQYSDILIEILTDIKEK